MVLDVAKRMGVAPEGRLDGTVVLRVECAGNDQDAGLTPEEQTTAELAKDR